MGANKKKQKKASAENSSLHAVKNMDSFVTESPVPEKKHSVRNWLKEYSGVLSFFVALVTAVGSIFSTFVILPYKVDALGEQVATLQQNVEDMKVPLASLWFEKSGETLKFEASTGLFVLDYKKSNFVASLVDVNTYEVNDISHYAKTPDEVYVYDMDGTKHSLSDIENNAIMVPYYESGKFVVFYGFINENGHWDKECIINAYDNGELSFSSIDQYDDGVSLSKNVCFSEDGECSIIQSCEESGDVYDCYRYTRNDVSISQPNLGSLNEDVLELPQDFIKKIQGDLIHHYHGGIVDEKYTDDTGKAYFISYYPDGYVKTLYNGGFKEGEFADETGRAWYITQDRDNDTDYMYYRGVFRNGTASKITEERIDIENPVSRDTISFLVNSRPYDEELVWDDSKIAK